MAALPRQNLAVLERPRSQCSNVRLPKVVCNAALCECGPRVESVPGEQMDCAGASIPRQRDGILPARPRTALRWAVPCMRKPDRDHPGHGERSRLHLVFKLLGDTWYCDKSFRVLDVQFWLFSFGDANVIWKILVVLDVLGKLVRFMLFCVFQEFLVRNPLSVLP